MCGICGKFSKNGTNVSIDELERMCNVIIHRGPDDAGYYLSGHTGLGMRRLKIIDLETGHQPIHNEDKTIWVVLNGEIYNFKELRLELEEKGHRFYTKSDTEVIVHLYEEYGEQTPIYLNGMFCFAIWDTKLHQLFIARDRLGVKQVNYYEDEKQFVFGSEIKSILTQNGVNREIDYQALNDYFSLLYIPAPHTIYKQIKKLPPACSLTIGNGIKRINRYWTLKYDDERLSGEDAIDFIDKELQRSVKYQMISDVPLGVYLSGGIDSSLLVAIMAKVSDRPIETFSIIWGPDNKEFDESTYARFVSKTYKTNHHEFLVKPQMDEVLQVIVQGFDEPFADDSAIPNYYIAHEARKHVTVVLSGLGGDEMSAGYERYLGMKLLGYYQYIPERIRSGIIPYIIHMLPEPRTGYPWIERMKRFVSIQDNSFVDRYFAISSKIDTINEQLFSLEAIDKIGREYTTAHYFQEYIAECNSNDELNKMLYVDMNTYMVDQLLVLSDRMSMAHSLELRVPFLDHILVEGFAQVKPSMKLRGPTKKYLLKRVAERYFPKSFIHRKKMGFSSPIPLWLRGDLKDFMLRVLDKKNVEKTHILNTDTVDRYIKEHLSRKRNHDLKLWSFIMFMIWYNTYINKIFED